MIIDGLWDVYNQYHMGITAENIADFKLDEKNKIFLLLILKLLINEKKFEKKLFVEINKDITCDKDEFPKAESSVEKLATLKPGGTVTAGNASGINDGAAAACLMTAEMAKKKNINH